MNNSFTYSLVFVAGVLIGGAIGAFVFSDSFSAPWSVATVGTSTGGVKLAPDRSGRVAVSDQGAGTSVTVASVTVPPPGVWVAVREVFGDELGNVLGATRARTSTTSLLISLLRETVPEHRYVIALYRDNGDDLFDLASDSVYVDFDTGVSVVAPFRTTP